MLYSGYKKEYYLLQKLSLHKWGGGGGIGALSLKLSKVWYKNKLLMFMFFFISVMTEVK
jgi:hypothetical protein